MKNNFLKLSLLVVVFDLWSYQNGHAQNEDDALRYAQIKQLGTARSTAMGGAFGALGSDFSVAGINPAGLGLYRKSELSFSPCFSGSNVSSSYLGESNTDSKLQFNVANFGIVLSGQKSSSNPWKGISLAFGYNRLSNFSASTITRGNNSSNSITDIYLAEAKGKAPAELPPFGTNLAWNTYLIDTLKGSYFSEMRSDINKTQQKITDERGGMGETVLSLAGNYENKLFFGTTIGFQKIRYWSESNYSESPVNDTFDLKGFTVNDYLNTDGNGINLKLGMIYMPAEFVRLGLAMQSPTYFNMHDSYSSSMSTSFNDGTSFNAGTDASGGGDRGSFDYRYNSPYRATGSLAFIFPNIGLISADYEYVDYAMAVLRAPGYSFVEQNSAIREKYKAVGNIRVGSEIKLVGPFSARLGYAYYPSAFKNSDLKSLQQFFSGGFGYREESFFADISYTNTYFKDKQYLYDSTFNPSAAARKVNTGIVNMTVGLRF